MAIYDHKGSDGEAQPHAYVLLVTRTVNEQGFGLKDATWNKTELLCAWRDSWQEVANTHLARAELGTRFRYNQSHGRYSAVSLVPG